MATILVVDDSAINRELLVTLLSYANHKIIEATNGEIAFDLVRREKIDLVITDILMPVMDGYEFAKKMHNDPQLSKIPVIFYTATYRLSDAALIALKCGVKHVLPKPSDPEVIYDMVNSALAEIKNVTPEKVVEEQISPQTAAVPNLKEYEFDIDELEKEIQNFMEHTEAAYKGHERLLSLSKKLTANLNKLLTVSNRLFSFFEFNSYLISIKDKKQLLEAFVKGARRLQAVKYCGLGILKNDTLYTFYLASETNNVLQSTLNLPPSENNFLQTVMRQRTAVKINNVHEELQAEIAPNHPAIETLLGVPIVTSLQLHGFLYFADKLDQSTFTSIDVELAIAFASIIALLYENLTCKKGDMAFAE